MNALSGRDRGRPKAFHDKSQDVIIQSLDRAMDVLKTVASGSGMTLTKIAETGAIGADLLPHSYDA